MPSQENRDGPVTTMQLVKGEDLNHHQTLYAGRCVEWCVQVAYMTAENCFQDNRPLVFMSIRRGPLVACKGGGRGNVTATHLAWTSPAAPDVPTPVCDGTFVYVVQDIGMMSCLDIKTGQARYLK